MKYLLFLLATLFGFDATAVTQYWGSLNATNSSIVPYAFTYTNLNDNTNSLTVAGSTFPDSTKINGIYAREWTNSGNGQSVFTNSTSTNIIYFNDPGVNIGGVYAVIEGVTNDPNWATGAGYYIPVQANPTTPNTWVEANGSDVLVVTYSPLNTTTNFNVLSQSNVSDFFYATQTTNMTIIVDPIKGNDLFAQNDPGIPCKTLYAAGRSPFLTNGGTIECRGFVAAPNDTNAIDIPPYVTLNANHMRFYGYGSVGSASSPVGQMAIRISSGDVINDLVMTNGNILLNPNYTGKGYTNIVVNRSYIHGSIDSFYLNIDGSDLLTLTCNQCDTGSAWDGFRVIGGTTNSVVVMNQCSCSAIKTTGNPQLYSDLGMHGFHALGFLGKSIINGGYYTALGGTNISNNDIAISGGTNTEIYGPTCYIGTTTASVAATYVNAAALTKGFFYGASNQFGVNIAPGLVPTMYGLSPVTFTNGVNANIITNSVNGVGLNLSSGSIIGVNGATFFSNALEALTVTIGNPTNTATGTLLQTNFISGKLYTNIYGRPISISANATLTTTGVSGNSSLSLLASGYLTNAFAMSTIVTSIAMSYTNVISMVIPASQTYTFTNTSAGAGDSSSVVGGQILVQ